MTDRPHFRPFETDLDEGRALAILRETVAGADDGELFLERRRSESLVYDDGRLRTASYDSGEGFGLRAVVGEVAGYAHSTDLSEAALRRAAETARLAARDGGGTLAPPPVRTNLRLYGDLDPFEGPDFASRVATLAEIDDYLRSRDGRVVQATASLAASIQEIEILRPEGMRFAESRPLTRMNVSVIVERMGGANPDPQAWAGAKAWRTCWIAPPGNASPTTPCARRW
jgi:TldD protein